MYSGFGWFRSLASVVGLGLLLGAVGCKKSGPTLPALSRVEAKPASVSGAPVDLGAVMRQVHFAFRPEGSQLTGGDATFEVAVDPTGAWTIAPRHFPDGRPAGSKPSVDPDRVPPADLVPPRHERSVLGAPLALGPARIHTGGRALGFPGSPAVEKDGHLARWGAKVVEHLRNTEKGVEQSWEFAEAPGSGELVIEVPVSGLQLTGETDSGLHFQDAATGLGICYGNATWIDAAGTKTAVRVKHVGNAVRLQVPGDLVKRSRYPAMLDPTVGPEFGMDNPVSGPESGSAYSPRIAFGGGQYLVVWQDYRNAETRGADIFGRRLAG